MQGEEAGLERVGSACRARYASRRVVVAVRLAARAAAGAVRGVRVRRSQGGQADAVEREALKQRKRESAVGRAKRHACARRRLVAQPGGGGGGRGVDVGGVYHSAVRGADGSEESGVEREEAPRKEEAERGTRPHQRCEAELCRSPVGQGALECVTALLLIAAKSYA